MANTINDLYLKYVNKVGKVLESDRYFQYMFEMVQGGNNTLQQANHVLHKVVDERWLTTIEDSLDAINTIIDNPRRFVTTKEEVVPVALAKKISAESVRHLSQNTQFIASNEDGEIQPTRILNVSTEESYDLYENRFIYTLIQRLVAFIDKRTDIIFWSTGDEKTSTLSLKNKVDDAYEEIEYKVEMTIKNKQSFAENDSENMEVFKRIDRVRRLVMGLRNSAFCGIMNGCTIVHSPIQRTNLMIKDPYYRKCYNLWHFLESYEDVGYTIDVKDTTLEFDEDYLFQIYTNFITNYVVFKSLLENDHRRIEEAPAKRHKVVKPKFIKQIVEQIVDDYDIPDVEIKKVIVEEVTKAQLAAEKKREAEEKKKEAEKARLDAEKAKEKARIAAEKAKEAEKEKAAKEAERAKIAKEKALEKEKIAKQKAAEKEKARIAAEKAKAKAAADKAKALEKEKIAKQKAAEKAKIAKQKAAEKEKARIAAEKAKAKAAADKAKALEKEKIAKQKAAEKEKARIAAEKAKAKAAADKAKALEREKLAKEKAAEKARLDAEKTKTSGGASGSGAKRKAQASDTAPKTKNPPKAETTVAEITEPDKPMEIKDELSAENAKPVITVQEQPQPIESEIQEEQPVAEKENEPERGAEEAVIQPEPELVEEINVTEKPDEIDEREPAEPEEEPNTEPEAPIVQEATTEIAGAEAPTEITDQVADSESVEQKNEDTPLTGFARLRQLATGWTGRRRNNK